MKNIKILVCALSLFLMFGSSAFAWSYSDYSNGSYVPKSGSGIPSMISSGGNYDLATWVSFQFDSTNVTNVLDYNDGGNNPGTACDNDNAYITLDQTADPDSSDLEIDADSVTTNLPNPVIDIEDNSFFGDDDESEVTALGTVNSSTTYYMQTRWNDYRDGGSGDSGIIQAQFAMSTHGFSDYNNCTQSTAIQHTFQYGDNLGTFALRDVPNSKLASLKFSPSFANYFSKGASAQPASLNSNENVISSDKVIEKNDRKISAFEGITLYNSFAKDEKGIKKYIEDNRRKLDDLKNKKISDVAVTISFSDYLSFERIDNFIKKHNITIKQLHGRGIDEKGDRVTFAQKGLKQITLSNKQSEVEFLGYTDLQGYINSDNIQELLNDQIAYAIDASGDNTLTLEESDSFPHSLTWDIENLKDKQ